MPSRAVAVAQNVFPSGENPLSWPSGPIGSELRNAGCRQSSRTL